MKNLTILLLLISNSLWAQNKPESIQGKDLIEVEKPEFEENDIDVEIDDLFDKMEVPVIDQSIKTSKSTAPATPEPKPMVKPKPNPVQEVAKPVVKPVAKPNSPSTQEVAKPVSSNKPKINKIVDSNSEIGLNLLKKNDLIRKDADGYSVYRRVSGKIMKYKLTAKLDMRSSGLEHKNETNSYIRNLTKLKRDSKELNDAQDQVTHQQQRAKREAILAAQKAQKEKASSPNPVVSGSVAELRKQVEESQNYGKSIKKEIGLSKLLTNDLIYIFDSIQLVHRKNKSTSGTKKMWLVEPIDPNNPSLEKLSANKFKVLRKYRL